MNLEKFLNKKYCFLYNEAREKVLVKEKVGKNKPDSEFVEITDRIHNSIVRRAAKRKINTSSRELKQLLNSDFVKSFCPFKTYFEDLPEWDGITDHISQLASTIKATDNEFFNWAFKKWIVAMVACSVEKSAVNQTVLILSGRQGVGKTTWLKNILPKELKKYFVETSINPSNKDSTILLTENILVNMDELTSFNKSNTEKFKELISKEVITERKPFGMYVEDYTRRASFSGTTNHLEFLTDLTGNRRYLCIQTEEIEYGHSVDMSKVYAQAYSLFKDGFQYYFDDEDVKRLERNNESFRSKSGEEEIIDRFIRKPNGNENFELMNATDIYRYLEAEFIGKWSIEKVGKIMSSKGYVKSGKQKKYKVVLIGR